MKYIIYKYLSLVLIVWGALFVIVIFASLFSDDPLKLETIFGSIFIGIVPMILGIIFFVNINKNQKKHSSYKIENAILKLAKSYSGILTESEASVSLNISLEDARKTLQELCTKGYAEADVNDNGVIQYFFKAFMK